MKTIILIPARGGSQGVPRKNIRLLNDKPLLLYVLETIKNIPSDIDIDPYVMTDDEEIEYIARNAGFNVVKEEKTTGKATLDDVTLKFLESLDYTPDSKTLFLTIQPTCPFLKIETIIKSIELLSTKSGSILTVKDDRHLAWTIDEKGSPSKLYKERLNRQQLPANFKESGAIIGSTIELITKNKTRINEPINLVEVSKEEGIDIDDFYDWSMAEYITRRKKIIIRADAAVNLGMGHVYRSLSLAQELAEHDILFYTNNEMPLGENFFKGFPFKQLSGSEDDFVRYCHAEKPDYIFLDILDTTKEFVQSIRSQNTKVITFEDSGTGANEADLLVSDLYFNDKVSLTKQLTGINNSILAPSFDFNISPKTFSNKVKNLLILFGGTDPSDLTQKALEALKQIDFKGSITVIQGMGKQNKVQKDDFSSLNINLLSDVKYMPKYMLEADMAISSAGRTITELISSGVPTICICQNPKEMTHTHASQQYGILNIGLGSLLDSEAISKHLEFMIDNVEYRRLMAQRAIYHGSKRSNKNIVSKILSKL